MEFCLGEDALRSPERAEYDQHSPDVSGVRRDRQIIAGAAVGGVESKLLDLLSPWPSEKRQWLSPVGGNVSYYRNYVHRISRINFFDKRGNTDDELIGAAAVSTRAQWL